MRLPTGTSCLDKSQRLFYLAWYRKLLVLNDLSLQILQLPSKQPRPKFEVSFFNDDKLAYVPSSGLFDFVKDFHKWVPKKLTNVSDYIRLMNQECQRQCYR
jgi:hypothetical protein